ncbi:MAG TPA: hypothetical protein PK228_18715, partial [Saprospiraceae bacterium]|nr:hypothetical protein [Saprospiraceae bacterium]
MKKISFPVLFSAFLLSAVLSAQSPESDICTNPVSQINLDGNGLLARLLAAGDFGWNLSDAVYFPNYVLNSPEPPATIFLGGLWYGGIDPAGNLKLKATSYRSNGETSFFSGPLDPATGITESSVCYKWDRHFRVTAGEVAAFLDDLADGSLSGNHMAVRGWPARGNPFFFNVWGFDLPFTNQALAP